MPETSNDKTIPVRVALRIRPLVHKEIGDGCQECIAVMAGEPQVVIGNDKAFTYDYVYGTTAPQSDLHEKTVSPLLEKLFKGYNATVLAYGQTGSGKTYTMGTSFTACTNTNDKDIQGVIPRVVSDIFDYMEKKKEETEFLLKCSFLEIHNEEIHDLLRTSESVDKIAIRENVEGDIMISGLSELPVVSGQEMVKLLCNGSASRATGATSMNSTSSRSHAIFTIIMEQKDKTGDGDFRRAKFHLVDLAGSERAKRTNAQGERFKEGVNINKGLLALGNVISALSDENRKSNAHVPYRDSKLTRLLQDSLGGNSNTVMIACISPADSNYEETLNTLRYADRARQIKNKPIVNRDPVAAEMAKLKQQVQMLQLQLLQGQTINGGLDGGNESGLDLKEVLERVKQLEEENLKLSQELHNSINQNTTMYEKVLMAELSRDKIIRQYDELKHYLTDKKGKVMPSLTESSTEIKDETNLAYELQKKFHQFEESCTASQQAISQHDDSQNSVCHNQSQEMDRQMDHEGSLPSSPLVNSSFESQHALRQAELARQVQELSKALTMKQELAEKMQQTEGAMNERMVKQYEVTVRELESEINKLEKEKAELSVALSAVKTATSESDSSKSRHRIKELEAKITEMKKKQVELQKLQRLKQQGDATISKLNTEIHSMKSVRVKLMRQMKEESERFRNLKKEKEREIMQLKQKDRKRQFEYTKLQNIHQKQQAVLKRKTQEAAAANKRLHDALAKRKEAADKRENYHYIQNKHSDNLIPRMKSWLSHEVELLASVAHAKKTLEELIEDRKTISHQLWELREKEQDDVDQPPAKKMFGIEEATKKKPEKSEKEMKIKAIEGELKIKSSQIAELQKKIGDADANVIFEKSKHRWNNVHTMAEAKAGLQVLLSMAVDDKSKLIKTERSMEGDKEEIEELRQSAETLVNNHKKELQFLRRDNDKMVTSLQQEHQEKVLLLLQQIPTEEEKLEISHLRELVKTKDNELEEKRRENDMLQQRFDKLSEALSSDITPNMSLDIGSEKDNKIATKSESQTAVIKERKFLYYDDEEGDDDDDDDDNDDDDSFLNGSNDPDYAPTPRIVRKRNGKRSGSSAGLNISGDNCNCGGGCKRGCPCKKRANHCGDGCQCKVTKCTNRPKDPKTPVLFSGDSYSESDLSTNKENESPFLQIQKKSQLPSEEKTPLSSTKNSIVFPKSQETHIQETQISKVTQKPQESKSTPKTQQSQHDRVTPKEQKNPNTSSSKTKLPQNQQKTPSVSSMHSTKADKWRKIRRKSTVLSKKQGVKNSSTTHATPNRNVFKTPGSAFTPSRINKTLKLQTNAMIKKKNINGQVKQQKRKLQNPSSLPPFAF